MNIRKVLMRFKNYVGEWARSLDKGLLWAIFLLIVFGVLLTFSASPEAISFSISAGMIPQHLT